MGSHYEWAAKGVKSEEVDSFAARLQSTLNELETSSFEIYDVMDAPTRGRGVVVIGRKPRRFPAPPFTHAPDPTPLPGALKLDPARLQNGGSRRR